MARSGIKLVSSGISGIHINQHYLLAQSLQKHLEFLCCDPGSTSGRVQYFGMLTLSPLLSTTMLPGPALSKLTCQIAEEATEYKICKFP